MDQSQKKIVRHTDLEVYKDAFQASTKIFELSRKFPREETYSLTDQLRRASRSVCSNIAEGWRKRRYEKLFVSKLNDAEAEAAETQVWLQFAVECRYLDRQIAAKEYTEYDALIGRLVNMENHPEQWVISS